MFRKLAGLVSFSIALIYPLHSFGDEHHPHWSYAGETGPTHWGSLEQDFSTCNLGKYQSPIDIRPDAVKSADLPAIQFDYKDSPLKIIDNGHTIQINYAPGSSITVSGHRYELVQFHFHKPSEESINGKRYDMVAHLVHKDADGKLAVVAVLLDAGDANPLIDTLWSHMPTKKEVEQTDAIIVNASKILPSSTGYYTFAGSLTTPPCSEGVTWFVLKNPKSVSREELSRFGKLYPRNARPVQPLDGREIKASR
jgi:carbonic anhydrase